MFYAGRETSRRFIPERLRGSFQGFLILAGLGFAIATFVPGEVGAYAGSLESAHGGRLFPYALTLLLGALGLQIGDELGGLPYCYRPVLRQILHLAGLVGLALGLAAPLVVVYRAWTGALWSDVALALVYWAVSLTSWGIVGAALTRAVVLDERRFVAKLGFLVLVMFPPLISPVPLSPLAAAADIWSGVPVQAVVGCAVPTATALVGLGVILWSRRAGSSVGPTSGPGSGVPYGLL